MSLLDRWARRWDARILAGRDRLQRGSPGAYRVLLAVATASYLVTDALVPRRRVRALTTTMVAMTLFDSIATYVWVTRSVAIEGNPLVDRVVGTFGEGWGLTLRTVFSGALVVLLGALARRYWEARFGLAVAGLILTLVTVVHGVVLVAVLRS